MSNVVDTIQEHLFSLQDIAYADFQAKLTPGFERDYFIGVRVPLLRAYAKECLNFGDIESFLKNVPHLYFEENMLHGFIVALEKDYASSIRKIESFLPYVNNWAVCDTLKPMSFKKHKDKLILKIDEWTSSKETYTIRFGFEMLMNHFLSSDFKPEYLQIPKKVSSDEYYVNMMIAWYYATALAYHWEDTILIIEEKSLSRWVHNKTIQKAIESNRITEEQKNYLRTLKV